MRTELDGATNPDPNLNSNPTPNPNPSSNPSPNPNPNPNPNPGMRIMIYVAITAVGTLLINATTTGPIVRRLGLTAIPKVELKAMSNVRQHGQSAPLGRAPARPLCLLRARLAALDSSALPGRGQPTGRPAAASGARASRLQRRPFPRL